MWRVWDWYDVPTWLIAGAFFAGTFNASLSGRAASRRHWAWALFLLVWAAGCVLLAVAWLVNNAEHG